MSNRGYGYEEPKSPVKKYAILGGAVLAVILIASIAIAGIRTIDEGYVGIKKTGGQAQPGYLSPGYNLVTPFVDTVEVIETRTQKYVLNTSAASKDVQTVTSEITTTFEIEPANAVELYKQLGSNYVDRILDPAIKEGLKASTIKYSADELVLKRPLIKNDVETYLRDVMKRNGMTLKEVFMTDFAYDPSYEAKIKEAQAARKELETQQNLLAKIKIQAEQAVAQAEGARDAAIAQAEGEKQSAILRAQGEAESVKLINQQLQASPTYIQYLQAQKWDGKMPTFVGGGDIPFILNMGDLEKKAE